MDQDTFRWLIENKLYQWGAHISEYLTSREFEEDEALSVIKEGTPCGERGGKKRNQSPVFLYKKWVRKDFLIVEITCKDDMAFFVSGYWESEGARKGKY